MDTPCLHGETGIYLGLSASRGHDEKYLAVQTKLRPDVTLELVSSQMGGEIISK